MIISLVVSSARVGYTPAEPRLRQLVHYPQRQMHSVQALRPAMRWLTPRSKSPSKKLGPLVRQVATAFPHATVELWATDEQRIGLKPLLHRLKPPFSPDPHPSRDHRSSPHHLLLW